MGLKGKNLTHEGKQPGRTAGTGSPIRREMRVSKSELGESTAQKGYRRGLSRNKLPPIEKSE